MTPPDPVVEAYSRMRKAQELADAHVGDGRNDPRLGYIYDEIIAAQVDLQNATPTTWQGACCKAKHAAMEFACIEPDDPDPDEINKVEAFFQRPFGATAEWFGELRALIDEIKLGVGCQHGGVLSLKQIYNGLLTGSEVLDPVVGERLVPLPLHEMDDATGEVECKHCDGLGRIDVRSNQGGPIASATCRVCAGKGTLGGTTVTGLA